MEPESANTIDRPSSAGRTAAQSMVALFADAVADSTSGCVDPVPRTVTVTGTSIGRSFAAVAIATAVPAGTPPRKRPELTVFPPADNVTPIVSPALASRGSHASETNMLTPRNAPGGSVQLACWPGVTATLSAPCANGS